MPQITAGQRLTNLETAVFGGPNIGDNLPGFLGLLGVALIALLTGSTDAIPVAPGIVLVNSTGVDAMTLAAPSVGGYGVGQDGTILIINSLTAHAHTITATGLLNTGAAGTGVLTFAAHAGAGVILMAYGGKWYVLANNDVTVTS